MIFYNGASGSLGRYLAFALDDAGQPGHILHARLEDAPGLRAELAPLALEADPVLLQLAARVSVPACEADPSGTQQLNVTETVRTVRGFVDWAQGRGRRPTVVYVSTGHVYAPRAAGTRLTEDAPTAPRSAYARSKLAAEEQLAALSKALGVPLVVARVFGLVAPRQPAHYVLQGLLQRLRERRIEGIPGLDFVRDYLDARDVCAGLVRLARAPTAPGRITLNLCSGEETTIRQLLALAARTVAPTEAEALLQRATSAPGRADDIPWLVGDPSAWVAVTGRAAKSLSLERTIRDACSNH